MEQFIIERKVTPKRGPKMTFSVRPYGPAGYGQPEQLISVSDVNAVLLRLDKYSAALTGGLDTFEGRAGMRIGLAFVGAKFVLGATGWREFIANLDALPDEVVLYWFTLCFYGGRKRQARKALVTLLKD